MSTNTGASRSDDGPAAVGSTESAQRGQRSTNPRGQGRGNRGRFNNRTRDRVPPPKKFAGKEEGLGDEFVYQQHTHG
jgi:hypothetical protein